VRLFALLSFELRKDTNHHEPVITLGHDAGNVGSTGICGHNPPSPNRIPEEEDGQAGEHAPMSKLGTASLKNEVCDIALSRPESRFLEEPPSHGAPSGNLAFQRRTAKTLR